MILSLLSTCILLMTSPSQPCLLQYIQNASEIREGGSSLYRYDDKTYLVSVASLDVGSKNEIDCQKVGDAKAKREMLSYINGSKISSYTELTVLETQTDILGHGGLDCRKVETTQEYVETITEMILGTINQTTHLGGWYSEDKTVYYFAIYKIIEQ